MESIFLNDITVAWLLFSRPDNTGKKLSACVCVCVCVCVHVRWIGWVGGCGCIGVHVYLGLPPNGDYSGTPHKGHP